MNQEQHIPAVESILLDGGREIGRCNEEFLERIDQSHLWSGKSRAADHLRMRGELEVNRVAWQLNVQLTETYSWRDILEDGHSSIESVHNINLPNARFGLHPCFEGG
jgi:hypothetical protein